VTSSGGGGRGGGRGGGWRAILFPIPRNVVSSILIVQIIEELMNQYQGYHPPQYMAPPPEYYMQSMEENPTSFVVC
jgi:hypothetical protein